MLENGCKKKMWLHDRTCRVRSPVKTWTQLHLQHLIDFCNFNSMELWDEIFFVGVADANLDHFIELMFIDEISLEQFWRAVQSQSSLNFECDKIIEFDVIKYCFSSFDYIKTRTNLSTNNVLDFYDHTHDCAALCT